MPHPTAHPDTPTKRRPPIALVALCAWLFPGLGHALLGEHGRACICASSLTALFLAGLLIGGIDAVDRRNDKLWFAGQALIGPLAFAADAAHQSLDDRREAQIAAFAEEHGYNDHEALPAMLRTGVPPAYRTSIGRPNEIGTLYCAVAGAMNLLVILDAIARAASRSKV